MILRLKHVSLPRLTGCALALLAIATGCSSGTKPIGQISSASADPSSEATNYFFDESGNAPPDWAGQQVDEPFDVRAFLASRTSTVDNAAPLYLAALAPICASLSAAADSVLERKIA